MIEQQCEHDDYATTCKKCKNKRDNSKSALVRGYTLSDYDRWFKPCEKCGFDTGRASEKSEARCWKCGNIIQRDFSERALKKSV